MGSLVAVALAFAQALPPAPPPSSSSLEWDAPPSCPTVEDVRARIASRVDVPTGDVRVHVVEVDDGVRVEMSTEGAERSFVAPTCDDAATAVAVIVALAAHAKAAEATQPPPPPAPRPVEPPPVAPPPAVPAEQTTPPTRRATRLSVSASTAFDGGSLPRMTAGLGVGVQARRGIGALALSGSAFVPQTEHASGEPPVQTEVILLDLLALGCLLVPVTGRVDVGGCAGGGVGMLGGKTRGIDQPGSNVGFRPEGALLGRAELALVPDIAVLRLETGGIADPIRPIFHVQGVGDVYRPPALAARIALGLDVRFP